MKEARNYIIKKSDVGTTYMVHNGKSYVGVFVEVEMVGYKLGQFVLTKQKLYHIHTKQKKKKK